MGELDKDYWRRLDDECVAAEAELAEQKSWVDDSVEDSLTELDNYLRGLSVEEHEAALAGLKWYEKHFMDDEELEAGWHRNLGQ